MHSQNSLQRRLISLTIALIFAVFLTADNAFAHVSVSCKAGPPTWKWTVHLKAGDVLKKGDTFVLVFGVPVIKKNLITPPRWQIKSVKDNRVQWKYIGGTINTRYYNDRDDDDDDHLDPVAVFGYKDARVVNGTVQWKASFPRNTSGKTCGPVSLTSPNGGSLAAPSAHNRAVAAFVSSESGTLQSADGTVIISFPDSPESETEEIIYMPHSETEVDNFTVVRSFTLDTYEEDDQPQAATLNQPVMVQATYTDVELNEANEEELKLYYFDSASSEWVPVRSTVDKTANKVVAELSDSDSFNRLYVLMTPALPEASTPPTQVAEPSPPGPDALTGWAGVALIVLTGWLGLRKLRQWKARSNKQ